jgi:hypothetical protein
MTEEQKDYVAWLRAHHFPVAFVDAEALLSVPPNRRAEVMEIIKRSVPVHVGSIPTTILVVDVIP